MSTVLVTGGSGFIGCHPLPAGVPKHEDELIVPAREGALRVLRAARDTGVRRVVLTCRSQLSVMDDLHARAAFALAPHFDAKL
jgi:nucleoside-diphosphate-sugar epimerase